MTRYLVRHDRPAVAPGVCYGSTDLPPAVPPEETASLLRPSLPAHLPVYSSPLRRCAEVARALHPAAVLLEGLREVDYGEWEMRPWSTLEGVEQWARDPFGFRFPGGESVPAFLARVREAFAGIPDPAIVVTHGGVIRAALHEPGGRTLKEAFETPVPLASVVWL